MENLKGDAYSKSFMKLKHIDVVQRQSAPLQDFWSAVGRPEKENNPDMSVCDMREQEIETEKTHTLEKKQHIYTVFKPHLILELTQITTTFHNQCRIKIN